MKRIPVSTEDGTKYFRVPDDALNDDQTTYANQRGAGFYVTDTYYSPRGRVIERCYSCWDNGRGQCEGTFYRLVEDKEELIRDHRGYGLKDAGVEA